MGYIGVITHSLTIDPNFLGHPSIPLFLLPLSQDETFVLQQNTWTWVHESRVNAEKKQPRDFKNWSIQILRETRSYMELQ